MMTKRLGFVALATLAAAAFIATPATAATSKQKQDTCAFGADHQKLTGAKRKAFMTKCLSNKDDPRGPATGTPAQGASAPKQN